MKNGYILFIEQYFSMLRTKCTLTDVARDSEC